MLAQTAPSRLRYRTYSNLAIARVYNSPLKRIDLRLVATSKLLEADRMAVTNGKKAVAVDDFNNWPNEAGVSCLFRVEHVVV